MSSICGYLLGSHKPGEATAGLAPRSGGAAPRRHSPQFCRGAATHTTATHTTAMDSRGPLWYKYSPREENGMILRREPRSFVDASSASMQLLLVPIGLSEAVQTRQFCDVLLLCSFPAGAR